MRVVEMNVGVILHIFARRVIGDVEELVVVVVRVCDAVGVVAVLPDFFREVFAHGKGKAALYQLDAAFDGVIVGRRDQDVNVVGHDDEAVEPEAALSAVARERIHHEVGVCGALKDATALMGNHGDREGFRLNANAFRGIGGHISGAKAPNSVLVKCPG
jgi:hypothetical protein